MNNLNYISNNLYRRKKTDYIFRALAKVLTWSSLFVLAILLYHVSITGIDRLSFDFLDRFPSRFPAKAGIKSALHGSIWMLVLVTIISVPVGVATAIYLEEYGKKID